MNIRPSPIAGTWYPGDSVELKETIDRYLDLGDSAKLPIDPIALISPHAGYIYSGKTAGHAFNHVQGKSYDVVAVLSPFHNHHSENLLVSSFDAYSTPLGIIPINKRSVDQLNSYLLDSGNKTATPISFENEHSLEIILPFLQVAIENDFEFKKRLGTSSLN